MEGGILALLRVPGTEKNRGKRNARERVGVEKVE
jgi:hypothetical protein